MLVPLGEHAQGVKLGPFPVPGVQKPGMGPRYSQYSEIPQMALLQVDRGGHRHTLRNLLESTPGAEVWRLGPEVFDSLD